MKKITHSAPFDLRNQNEYFGGWPVLKDTDKEFAIVIAFPVEGWEESAAVVVSQYETGELIAQSYGTQNPELAIDQALATLSLDIDDTGWVKVGEHDNVIADLQKKYKYLRPVLFHSPYEAAAGFVIGQRISIKQRRAIQEKIAEQLGDKIEVEGRVFSAFPSPSTLLNLTEFPGLNATKVERLKGIAQAALDGILDRNYLTNMSLEQAILELQRLDGIGPFYASGILYRGVGVVNDLTDDDLTKFAVQQVYGLSKQPDQQEVISIAENWRPYRMWCEVLIHIWLRREVGLPRRSR